MTKIPVVVDETFERCPQVILSIKKTYPNEEYFAWLKSLRCKREGRLKFNSAIKLYDDE